MIQKQHILERAREWQLRAEVVEKDYVLGWILAAVAGDPEAGIRWVLKGGTCVKKCFFETYRFSEDLDFSLTPDAGYEEEALRETLLRVGRRTAEMSGIRFNDEQVLLRLRVDKQGRRTYEGRLGYQGPLAIPTWPRILFDITQHEPIIEDPVFRKILHPYPDELPPDSLVQTYAFEELLAEKARALLERARPRDLYDVVYIVNNAKAGLNFEGVRRIFLRKCEAKGISCPVLDSFVSQISGSEEIKADWEGMLAHQLPQLPTIETFLEQLQPALVWIEGVVVPVAALSSLSLGAQERVLETPSVGMWGAQLPLEAVRFAGANRLLVEFDYSGKRRLVEPYSLRRASTGNLLFYAWELSSAQIKAFNVARISNMRTTGRTFVPRYVVELAPGSAIPVSVSRAVARPRVIRRRVGRVYSGPTYILKCPVCGKEFRRRKNETTLRTHTYPGSRNRCPSRRGYLVRLA
jgi:predicted nucleotidyltransferase component of viral defense system